MARGAMTCPQAAMLARSAGASTIKPMCGGSKIVVGRASSFASAASKRAVNSAWRAENSASAAAPRSDRQISRAASTAHNSRSNAAIFDDPASTTRSSSSSQRELTAERRAAHVDRSWARAATTFAVTDRRASAMERPRWQRYASALEASAAAAETRKATGRASARLAREARRAATLRWR